MSFIDDVISLAEDFFGIEAEPDLGQSINQSAASDYVNSVVTSNVKTPENQEEPETVEIEVEQELEAKTDNAVPLVYGTGFTKGVLVDAQITNNNCTMWWAVALAEVTGELLDGTESEIQILEVYRNGNRLTVFDDGVTVAAEWEGNYPSVTANTDISGLMQLYFYNNGSDSPTFIRPQGISATHSAAYNYMPGWTVDHKMSEMAFVLIRLDYSAVNDITELGDIEFKIRNTMTDPGDVLVDYATNTRYGAGIPKQEMDI